MTWKTPKFRKNLLRGFTKTRKGATAVEMAFVLAPFLMLTVGTLEIALVHLSRSSVTNAMEVASRKIMTGTAMSCITKDDFINDICEHVSVAGSGGCKKNTKVDLQPLQTFKGQIPEVTGDFDTLKTKFQIGNGGDRMLLRTYHRWITMTPFLAEALHGENGSIVLTTNVAFINEPFSTHATCTKS